MISVIDLPRFSWEGCTLFETSILSIILIDVNYV